MACIVDGGTVEQNQVLVAVAAAHLIAARAFTLALHARQQLDALDDVLLTKQSWDTGQCGYLNLLDTYLHLVDTLLCRT